MQLILLPQLCSAVQQCPLLEDAALAVPMPRNQLRHVEQLRPLLFVLGPWHVGRVKRLGLLLRREYKPLLELRAIVLGLLLLLLALAPLPGKL